MPVPVAENLTWEEFSRINLHLPYLPGVQPDVGETRDYPFGDELVHVLGYVAAVSPEDMKDDDDPLLSLPGFRIGKRGIEKQFDKRRARPRPAPSRVEVNAYGRVIRELGHEAGRAGPGCLAHHRRASCSISPPSAWATESAACVVMDVANGDVLALASTPGYRSQLFNVGITGPTMARPDRPTITSRCSTRPSAGTYPPGSTFKTAMALAAVDNGMDDLVVNCTGSMRLGNHTFHCDAWRSGGHGHCDLAARHPGLAATSSSTKWRGGWASTRWQEVALQARAGRAHRHRIAGREIGGLIPSRAWKMKHYGVAWQQGDTLVSGIGQGYVTRHAAAALHAGRARIATGKAVSVRGWCIMVGAALPAAIRCPRRCPSPTRHSRRCARA